MNGLWLVPSLDRIGQLIDFFQAYKDTNSSTPGMVLVDQGDYISKQAKYMALELPDGWSIRQTTGVTMGDKCREVWDEVKGLDWVGLLNDDHRPRTMEWDKKILAHLNGNNIIGTNDGPSPDKPWMAPKKLCGATCWSGNVLRTIGWMFPARLNHLFIDDVWEQLAGPAQCAQIIMDVCVEHVHAYKDGEKDATFEKVNSSDSWQHDHAVFQDWIKNDAAKDIARLMAIQPKMGVMLATPSHDGDVALLYAVGLMDTGIGLTQQNIYFEFARVEGSSLIPHARNSLVDMFLKSKCQKLLFVDSDQGFGKHHVFALLQSKRPIIAGVTPHKRFPINLNFEPLEQDNHYFKDTCNKSTEEFFKFAKERADSSGEIEVNRSGTGFIMIDRSVFETMKDHVADYLAFDDNMEAKHGEYFRMGSMDGRFKGEDWAFTMLAKKLNIPIFINSNVLVVHKGTYTFTIDESKRLA